MGDTYGFSKVKRDKFFSRKSRFILDSDGCCIEDYNPDYIDIVGDLDREDFLHRLVKPNEGEIEKSDKELADFIKTYDSREEQAIVVTKDSVQRAIDTLKELDRKVSSMPCDKTSEAHDILKQFLEPEKWKYVEDKPKDPKYPNDPDSVYVSSCRENVDIYKEVEKVYGFRTYHYRFPWDEPSYYAGAGEIIGALGTVMEEMKKADAQDYVFLFAWI